MASKTGVAKNSNNGSVPFNRFQGPAIVHSGPLACLTRTPNCNRAIVICNKPVLYRLWQANRSVGVMGWEGFVSQAHSQHNLRCPERIFNQFNKWQHLCWWTIHVKGPWNRWDEHRKCISICLNLKRDFRHAVQMKPVWFHSVHHDMSQPRRRSRQRSIQERPTSEIGIIDREDVPGWSKDWARYLYFMYNCSG